MVQASWSIDMKTGCRTATRTASTTDEQAGVTCFCRDGRSDEQQGAEGDLGATSGRAGRGFSSFSSLAGAGYPTVGGLEVRTRLEGLYTCVFELLELKKVEAQLSSQHIMQTGEAKVTNKRVRSEFREAATASTSQLAAEQPADPEPEQPAAEHSPPPSSAPPSSLMPPSPPPCSPTPCSSLRCSPPPRNPLSSSPSPPGPPPPSPTPSLVPGGEAHLHLD